MLTDRQRSELATTGVTRLPGVVGPAVTAGMADAVWSADLRRKLTTLHPWFGARCREGGDRVRRFMVDGEEIDGVHVRVSELTADAGDVVVMLPWTLHGPAMNGAPTPRFMVTYSARRAGGRGQPALGDSPFTASQ